MSRNIAAVTLFAVTGLYILLAAPAFIFLAFGVGFVGDQSSDPRIDLLKVIAVVGSPGILICILWWLVLRRKERPQP